MSRQVFCVKLKKEAKGLETKPYPGEKGDWIFENVSKKAWLSWQQHQTRLINEKHLNLLDPETRKYLTEQMDRYFSDQSVDTAEGYIPGESEDKKSD